MTQESRVLMHANHERVVVRYSKFQKQADVLRKHVKVWALTSNPFVNYSTNVGTGMYKDIHNSEMNKTYI